MSYTDKFFEFARTMPSGLYWAGICEDGKISALRINPSNKNNDCYSVSKVFVVTAIGMLVDDGKLKVSDRIVDIFKDEMPENYDPKFDLVTVDMVLRHKWGLASGFLDIDAEDMTSFGQKYGSDTDYLYNVLSHRLELTPGVEERYSDAGYYLLSRVVAKIAGEDIFDFLRVRLFNPLRFEEIAWSRCPMGFSMGATGLFVRVVDLVKLGKLYLDDGVWEGNQIISKEWCDTVFQNGYELRLSGDEIYGKGGMFGQQLSVDKKRKLVTAWIGFDNGFWGPMFGFIKSFS